LGLGEVFDVVRERVDVASNGKQLPWTLSSVVGRYSFVAGTSSSAGNEPSVRPAPVPDAKPPAARIDTNNPSARQAGTTMVNPKDGLTYLWIPPGTFMMGCSPGDSECDDNEKPVHSVAITKGFWMGRTIVTQEAYARLTRHNPSVYKGEQLPVEHVSWYEARDYCNAVGMRLPTEAEWEYSSRAGSTASHYGELDEVAWNRARKFVPGDGWVGNDDHKTHEVMTKQPNAWGLYDTLSNVWQWTADWYGPYRAGNIQNPTGPPTGTFRVLRGGSAGEIYARGDRVSARDGNYFRVATVFSGFRCAAN
jgi:formylglycine-generating enzyme required for sulfatase activity